MTNLTCRLFRNIDLTFLFALKTAANKINSEIAREERRSFSTLPLFFGLFACYIEHEQVLSFVVHNVEY